MKEVMAIIRQSNVNKTRDALAEGGYPSLTCKRCMGRGRSAGLTELGNEFIGQIIEKMPPEEIEHISEASRLISKRLIIIVVEDSQAEEVAEIITQANSAGKPGDGKIFILPIEDNYIISSGERISDAPCAL